MVIQSLAVGAVGAVAIEVIFRLQPEMLQEPEEESSLGLSELPAG